VWELRAAMSLARLWQQQGKRTEARACQNAQHWHTTCTDGSLPLLPAILSRAFML